MRPDASFSFPGVAFGRPRAKKNTNLVRFDAPWAPQKRGFGVEGIAKIDFWPLRKRGSLAIVLESTFSSLRGLKKIARSPSVHSERRRVDRYRLPRREVRPKVPTWSFLRFRRVWRPEPLRNLGFGKDLEKNVFRPVRGSNASLAYLKNKRAQRGFS